MKIAFIVQRYGLEVVGGAELHCRWVAEHLAAGHDVEVLTTTAIEYLTWENEYPVGVSEVNGIRVRRFEVRRRRRPDRFEEIANKVCYFRHSDADERRWLDEHGPYCPDLIEYLRDNHPAYDALVFFCYRYWTTYHGLRIAPEKSLLAPTAEHDRVIYLRMFKPFFSLPAAVIYNSVEERLLIERVTQNEGAFGAVVGTGIKDAGAIPVDELAERLDLMGDYLLYIGRIEPEKGCAVAIDYFLRYQRESRRQLTLAMLGKSTMEINENVHIRLLGVTTEAEKFAALARARLLLMPSRHESLSMVLLEAWKMSRPVLVNGDCEVLRGQTLRANGGLYYRSYEEFAAALDLLLDQPALAERLGEQGHRYYRSNYDWEVIVRKYDQLLDRVVSGSARR